LISQITTYYEYTKPFLTTSNHFSSLSSQVFQVISTQMTNKMVKKKKKNLVIK